MKKEILDLLKKNTNAFVSGQDLSEKLGVSRTAIWKYINQIKDAGYEIESISKKGYKLISSPDILTIEEISPHLNTNFIGRNLTHFDSIESTNSKAKQLADLGAATGSIVIAEEQTNGRGRLGRSWVSPKYKGIWMSIILRPNLNPIDAVKLTQTAAAAIVKATNELGIKTYVKWPNDIVINHKKICGILTEMNAELTRINYVVVGIGINVNMDDIDLPEDLKDIATSLKIQMKTPVNRQEFVAKILNNFEQLYAKFIENNDIEASISICRENSAIIGKEILIINGEKKVEARALDIDTDGKLVVMYADETQEKLISGEVSIRGKDSYI